jgi:hypothetical protein
VQLAQVRFTTLWFNFLLSDHVLTAFLEALVIPKRDIVVDSFKCDVSGKEGFATVVISTEDQPDADKLLQKLYANGK